MLKKRLNSQKKFVVNDNKNKNTIKNKNRAAPKAFSKVLYIFFLFLCPDYQLDVSSISNDMKTRRILILATLKGMNDVRKRIKNVNLRHITKFI